MKPKRRPRRRLLILCIVVMVCILLLSMRDVQFNTTSDCVAVNPQDVGDMVSMGQMVAGIALPQEPVKSGAEGGAEVRMQAEATYQSIVMTREAE